MRYCESYANFVMDVLSHGGGTLNLLCSLRNVCFLALRYSVALFNDKFNDVIRNAHDVHKYTGFARVVGYLWQLV